ncbi:glycoside hydrolase family 25 [Sphingobium quisquiliarum P25]|uniref:Glycoside hydrolase family 25 n=1 Tax=Sphingobium quisquiliarum P25 TaxID=1329909 RepID=T0HD76_9SPHN|nr:MULTISPECIES: GH25 family lysozyme [Sphingobium]EQB10098.1 glycoside hydrolase family 25 [Sphingobium quisquiliarum P25]
MALWLYARGWAPDRSVYPVQGVTISADNGAIDWGTLAANGVDFAYIRAAKGADGRDPAFARNWSAARSAGLRYGASLDFSLCKRAAEQATRFVTTVPRDNAALPPVIRLSFDPSCSARPERDAVLSELNTLVNLVESNARKPALLNISPDFEERYDIASGINRTLWLDGNFFPPDYATRKWVMWTANDMRHIDGVEGPVRWGVVAP